MRQILFLLYLLLFPIYLFIDLFLAISLLPSILVSYWLLKDDIDLERIYNEVETLRQKIKDLEKK